jgi:hypothetical protein
MDIDPRTPYVSLMNTVQLLGGEKTSFYYWPDICCMCLLRGPNGMNGHIRVVQLHLPPTEAPRGHPGPPKPNDMSKEKGI